MIRGTKVIRVVSNEFVSIQEIASPVSGGGGVWPGREEPGHEGCGWSASPSGNQDSTSTTLSFFRRISTSRPSAFWLMLFGNAPASGRISIFALATKVLPE